jgi:hypothetical protein
MHDHWPVHSVLLEEDKMNHYPMTKEQRESLDHPTRNNHGEVGRYCNPAKRVLRDKDRRVERAQAAQAAVKGSLGCFEREPVPITSGNAGGSARVREMVEVDTKGNRTLRSLRGSTRPIGDYHCA